MNAENTNSNPLAIAYGAKYERDLDVAEIAKRVRADIKAAVTAGQLPRAKYAVRISRYSMGRSLSVSIDELPFPIVNEERVKRDVLGDGFDGGDGVLGRWTLAAAAVRQKVDDLVAAYNFDGSDLQSDYYNVNFHGSVDFGSQENREWTAFRVKYEAERREALRPEREASLAKHEALARRNGCPAKWAHDDGRGCGLCE